MMRNILLLVLLISSCTLKEKDKNSSSIEKEKTTGISNNEIENENVIDSTNQVKSKELSIKYNAIFGWDSIKLFTYSIQEIFKYNSNISFQGRITDVEKKNDSFILNILGRNGENRVFFKAIINREQFELLKVKLNPRNTNKGCFVIKPTKVYTCSPILESQTTTEGDSYLNYNFINKLIIVECRLIDYYLYVYIHYIQ